MPHIRLTSFPNIPRLSQRINDTLVPVVLENALVDAHFDQLLVGVTGNVEVIEKIREKLANQFSGQLALIVYVHIVDF